MLVNIGRTRISLECSGFNPALGECQIVQRVRSLSYLLSKTGALSFVVAHYDLLTIKALQVAGFRSLANARHFGL